jgi:hypothetical protein
MTTAHQEQPSLREHIDDTRQYLSAVAGKLTAHGAGGRRAVTIVVRRGSCSAVAPFRVQKLPPRSRVLAPFLRTIIRRRLMNLPGNRERYARGHAQTAL